MSKNRTGAALLIWAWAAELKRLRVLSRRQILGFHDAALVISAALMDRQTQAQAKTPDAALDLVVRAVVDGFEARGVSRADVAAAFNRAVMAPPFALPPDHVMVRLDRLIDLAGGMK